MKALACALVVVLLAVGGARGNGRNAIDALHTDADVVAFWRQHVAARPRTLALFPQYPSQRALEDSLGARNWLKADVDGNGETDLLLFRLQGLTQLVFVLSHGRRYHVLRPAYADPVRHQFVFPTVKPLHGRPVVLLYSRRQQDFDPVTDAFRYSPLACDTLTVRAGRVVEYAPAGPAHDIALLTLENNGRCEGNCPRLSLVLDAHRGTARAIKEEGWAGGRRYEGALRPADRQAAVALLRASEFPRWPADYRALVSDQTTTVVTIEYDGGRRKTITDYGSNGNFTLAELYRVWESIAWREVQ